MGVSRHMYLGPYARVSYPRVPKTKSRCLQNTCPKPESGFCPKCGMDSKKREYKSASRVSFFELFNEEERLTSVPLEGDGDSGVFVDFLKPNLISSHLPRDFNCDAGRAIIASEIKVDTEWFKSAYRSELSILEKEFGALDVIVEWGFLTWWY